MCSNFLFIFLVSHKLIKEIGERLKRINWVNKDRSTFFLTQEISMTMQRGNSSCGQGTVPRYYRKFGWNLWVCGSWKLIVKNMSLRILLFYNSYNCVPIHNTLVISHTNFCINVQIFCFRISIQAAKRKEGKISRTWNSWLSKSTKPIPRKSRSLSRVTWSLSRITRK